MTSPMIATAADGTQEYVIVCADPDGGHASRANEPFWANVIGSLSIDATPAEVERARTGYVCYPCYRAVYQPVPDPEQGSE